MTTWRPNEPTANARTCLLDVTKDDGTPAPQGTDFAGLGYLYFGGTSLPSLVAAAGTIANVRRVLSFTPITFTVNTGVSTTNLTATAHGLKTGDGPINVSNSGGALPTGLAALTDYYVIYVDANTIKLATSLANAYAGTAVTMSTNGTGTQTITTKVSGGVTLTQRGVDGQFLYTATQAETNHTFAESQIVIDGTVGSGYERSNGGGALTLVSMDQSANGWGDTLEAGHTRDDALRAVFRDSVAKINKTGTSYVVRDVADTKNSHHGTVTSAGGRSTAGIDDLT